MADERVTSDTDMQHPSGCIRLHPNRQQAKAAMEQGLEAERVAVRQAADAQLAAMTAQMKQAQALAAHEASLRRDMEERLKFAFMRHVATLNLEVGLRASRQHFVLVTVHLFVILHQHSVLCVAHDRRSRSSSSIRWLINSPLRKLLAPAEQRQRITPACKHQQSGRLTGCPDSSVGLVRRQPAATGLSQSPCGPVSTHQGLLHIIQRPGALVAHSGRMQAASADRLVVVRLRLWQEALRE
jgi:hypothetical protein